MFFTVSGIERFKRLVGGAAERPQCLRQAIL